MQYIVYSIVDLLCRRSLIDRPDQVHERRRVLTVYMHDWIKYRGSDALRAEQDGLVSRFMMNSQVGWIEPKLSDRNLVLIYKREQERILNARL